MIMRILYISILLLAAGCSTSKKRAFKPSMANQVFILEVPHFTSFKFKDLKTSVNPIQNALEKWQLTSICVESRHPLEAQEMMAKKVHFPTYNKLYNHFQRQQYEIGQAHKKKLKLSHEKISSKINAILDKATLKTSDRLNLIRNFLANYDYMNAYLHWSYLDDKKIVSKKVGKDVSNLFKKYDSSPNESFSIAVPLARKLGHKTICAMDSQRDATQIFIKGREKLLEELGKDPNSESYSKSALRQKSSEIDKAFETHQNLITLLEFYNSPTWIDGSDKQWDWERESSNKLAKVHYMGWELRNKRMSSNILEAAQAIGPQKVLVIVGAAHLHPLKEGLQNTDSTSVIEYNEVF